METLIAVLIGIAVIYGFIVCLCLWDISDSLHKLIIKIMEDNEKNK